MSARDELAKMLFITANGSPDAELDWAHLQPNPKYLRGIYDLADAVLVAGYRKPRTITTAEEVSGMAIDSIVRTHGGVPLELWEGETDEREWRVTGHRPWTDAELTKNLPATVLYEPEAAA